MDKEEFHKETQDCRIDFINAKNKFINAGYKYLDYENTGFIDDWLIEQQFDSIKSLLRETQHQFYKLEFIFEYIERKNKNGDKNDKAKKKKKKILNHNLLL